MVQTVDTLANGLPDDREYSNLIKLFQRAPHADVVWIPKDRSHWGRYYK